MSDLRALCLPRIAMNKKKIHKYMQELRYIVPTLYFNFHYLPFRQAIHLSIVLYKPHLLACKGKVRLEPEDGRIYHGMVRMGFRMVSIYPDNGITWEKKGGTVVFQGNCTIGNDCHVSFGPKTNVVFGHGFAARACFRLASYVNMIFKRYTRFGWDCLCMDTNFHPIYDMKTKEYKPTSGPIVIGDYNWFGMGCKVMHSVTIPERCIFGMGTVVTRGCVKKSYCVMGGSPVRILSENVMRDYEHDTLDNY